MALKKKLIWGFIIKRVTCEPWQGVVLPHVLVPGMRGSTVSRLGLQNIVSNLDRVQRGGTEVILSHGW